MRKLVAASGFILVSFLSGCSKTDVPAETSDPDEWMQTHPAARVDYVDYFTGNYIVNTSQGYAVVENWGGSTPSEGNTLYAYFQLTGMQTIYNRNGNFFARGRVVANWLSWFEAYDILQNMAQRGFN